MSTPEDTTTETFNNYNIHSLNGTFILNNVNQDESVKVAFVIGAGELTEQVGINPARGLASAPLIFNSGLGQYGTARTIEELQGATPEYPALYWWLFTLVAVYRDITFLSFTLEQDAVWSVYLETPEQRVYGWTAPHLGNDAYVIEGSNVKPGQPTMNPSEVMQAFAVTAEHLRMGSRRFAIQTLEESKQFVVSTYDHGDPTLRYDVVFPLTLPDAETPQIH